MSKDFLDDNWIHCNIGRFGMYKIWSRSFQIFVGVQQPFVSVLVNTLRVAFAIFITYLSTYSHDYWARARCVKLER